MFVMKMRNYQRETSTSRYKKSLPQSRRDDDEKEKERETKREKERQKEIEREKVEDKFHLQKVEYTVQPDYLPFLFQGKEAERERERQRDTARLRGPDVLRCDRFGRRHLSVRGLLTSVFG